jgi:hypothetical protein
MSNPPSTFLIIQQGPFGAKSGWLRQSWPVGGRMQSFGVVSGWQQSSNNAGLPNQQPMSSVSAASRPIPGILRRRSYAFWRPPGRTSAIAPNAYRHLSKYTLENCNLALKLLNFWMGTQSFIAAIFHGGYEIKGLSRPGKMIRGVYEPSKYSGLWPGIYKPGSPVRKWLIDAPLVASCFWDGGNAFLKYASTLASPGAGLAAGLAELANGLAFSVCYSEPIMFRIMDRTMQFLAKVTRSSKLRNLNAVMANSMEKASPELLKKGIPLYYRATRTLVAGALGLAGIEAIIKMNSTWVTPVLANKFGPGLDTFLKRYFPGFAKQTQPIPLKAFNNAQLAVGIKQAPAAMIDLPTNQLPKPMPPILPTAFG